MTNRIALVNTSEFPCPGSHLLHARKLLGAFSSQGYAYQEITADASQTVFELREGDIAYISNHGLISGQPSSRQIEILDALAKAGVVPIFWFWHEHTELLDSIFGSRWILTGEHLRAKNVLPSHEVFARITNSRENFVPSRFASALQPFEIGKTPRTNLYNASFVGHRYQRVLNTRLSWTLPKVKIVYTPPFISEDERISLFTSSHIVLGWHSSSNIVNGNVVERVFEGLAFGSAVITDNPFALEATDGNVLFANTYSQTKEYFERIISDSRFRETLQETGKAWAKSHGTYDSVANSFITTARNL